MNDNKDFIAKFSWNNKPSQTFTLIITRCEVWMAENLSFPRNKIIFYYYDYNLLTISQEFASSPIHRIVALQAPSTWLWRCNISQLGGCDPMYTLCLVKIIPIREGSSSAICTALQDIQFNWKGKFITEMKKTLKLQGYGIKLYELDKITLNYILCKKNSPTKFGGWNLSVIVGALPPRGARISCWTSTL